MTVVPQYKRWSRVIDRMINHGSPPSRVIIYLHLAKTGGTTANNCIKAAPDWTFVRMKESYISPDVCSCGDPSCPTDETLSESGIDGRGGSREKWFCHFVHERYHAARWFADEIRRRGGPPSEVHVSFRPARDRLVSMFKDYWRMALRARTAEGQGTPHHKRIAARYRADSEAYLDDTGRIDARAWFSAFSSFGAGMPFSMAEVFDASVMNLRLSLANGEMNIVQTEKMDDWLRALTGVDHVVRGRVSGSMPDNVVRALDEARDLIDDLAERDWMYDQAVDEYELMSRLGRRFCA